MSSPGRSLALAAALSAAGYAALAAAGDLRASLGLYLGVHALLFAAYAAASRLVLKAPRGTLPGFAPVAAAAIAFRLILIPSPPSLSDDIHRYVWEGRLQLMGINPYRLAPSDPALAELRDGAYEGVNYKDLPAIYPPVAQWAFALGALLGAGVRSMKVVVLAADAGLMLALARLLRARGMEPARVVLYAWNPLAVVETAHSGHYDPLALSFLVAATVGIIRERPIVSTTWLSLSAMSKLAPAALVPLFFHRRRPAALAVLPLAALICYLPYAGAGWGLLRSTVEYAERWRANDSLFGLLASGIELSGVSAPAKAWADRRGWDSLYTQPHMLARGAAGLLLAGWMAWLVRRRLHGDVGLERAVALFTWGAILLSPTVHPWYLLWAVAWLPAVPSHAWMALSGLFPLAYLGETWTRWAIYLPFYALLLAGFMRGGRSRV
ncbi:MAG TPA: glycosyltransferase 87 family protein [Candidatus Polarisedimenticolia bacterium]|nr:glycosyltransferase 87 family protein [Candidatus Polarisedimenticolia bacterium]